MFVVCPRCTALILPSLLDINECLSASCEGLCVNTEGGFVCECGPGMQLSSDRHSCQGESLGGFPGGTLWDFGTSQIRCELWSLQAWGWR